ncbi:NAD(P)/FAD-dependent oxidoreductase [Uliginosibacterium sp. sgz301328]|uniref:NAD(P)/FAD-dependent oxidoreductase n=1 Tax=Uliginosibacterium sp. sgz301328 TaxID=3243764 RepID=UPI00359E4BD7
MEKTFDVVVIGAGPAGLTAAYELARGGMINILVLESTNDIGGISKTANYQGNRIDIGGHRFFSKSKWVMDWWQDILPIDADAELEIAYHNRKTVVQGQGRQAPDDDNVMLVRNRLSRIYFDGKFFDYPLKASPATAMNLGLARCAQFGLGYAMARVSPIREECSLEDFMINRFGRPLYRQFFRDYTEKVWGLPCNQISAEWGAQRIKSLSIGKALRHAMTAPVRMLKKDRFSAKETSLIEHFLYPKFGPGQMWEQVAERVRSFGISIRHGVCVDGAVLSSGKVTSLRVREAGGVTYEIKARNVISTMPVRDLIGGLQGEVPETVRDVASGLLYRDFITVGLLYKRRLDGATDGMKLVPDNWVYIQEPGVKVGRLQFFNNWSPYMVANPDTVWVGMEYFCSEGDELWGMSESDLLELGRREMQKLRLASAADCLSGTVLKMPKAYPGYFGSYDRFQEVRDWTDTISNLYLVGRNGMHRYNNQDHSMLSAKAAADAILTQSMAKSDIWAINVDDEYHEEQKVSA